MHAQTRKQRLSLSLSLSLSRRPFSYSALQTITCQDRLGTNVPKAAENKGPALLCLLQYAHQPMAPPLDAVGKEKRHFCAI